MARALKAGQIIVLKGRKYRISRSARKAKYWSACPLTGGACIHFGAKGARVRPGTPKGDSFCARTLPLAKRQRRQKPTANDFARADWKCKGAKSG